MADTKISALSNAAALGGTEQIPGVQSGGNVNITPAQIATYVGLLTAEVSISSAEILNLNSTPKQLIAAPGAGKFIQLIAATAYYTHAGSAYANANDLQINHTNTNASELTDALDLNSVTINRVKQFEINDNASNGTGWGATIVANAGLYLRAQATNPTTGGGSLKIYLTYRIVTA
jgi:hypothetical protein